MRRPPPTALFFSAIVIAACTQGDPNAERRDRCKSMNEEIATCVGGPSTQLDCGSTTDKDLDRLSLAMDTIGCREMAESLPLDGDPKAAACRTIGIGCVGAVTPAPAHDPTRHPVILVNGIDTSPLFRYSDRIVRTMRDEGGHVVFLATLPPYEPPHRRAPLLWKRIEEVLAQTGGAKVNLVCHSLGGLDCRYVASPNGLAADAPALRNVIPGKIASITTVGTAHRGTRAADVALGLLPDANRGSLIEAWAGILGEWFGPAAIDGDPHLRESFVALSESQAPAFNAEIVDAKGILYQSWAGVSRPFGVANARFDDFVREGCKTSDGKDGRHGFVRHDWMALPLVPFARMAVQDEDEPSDGLTPLASAKWGEFRGCIPADHMEQLGQKNLPDANVQNGFDVARFYANVAGDLAGRGL
jgi:triacylglycerol lipase